MEIISNRETVVTKSHIIHFFDVKSKSVRYGFNVDISGNLTGVYDNEAARENLARCMADENLFTYGIEEEEHSYRKPAVGRCCCGEKVWLDGFTNTCDRCGRDYNMSGQLLAPRQFWCEGTDDTLQEILNIR